VSTQKPGSEFLYDDRTGDIIGCKDSDGSESKFQFTPARAVQFDTANPSSTLAVGEVRWNDTDGTLELMLKGGQVPLEIGQEQLVRIKNSTGTTLLKGQVVYPTGSDGVNKTVALAQANGEATSTQTLAVMAEDVLNGQSGWAATFGLVRGINTNDLDEGKTVYLSPSVAGGLTKTKPVAPDHLVVVGFCIRKQQNNGVLFVKIANGFELDELHNVLISNPQNGQVLKYSNGLWINQAP
jgi:hypothetical protein